MKWQLKALGLRVLGIVPLGRRLYRRMQDMAGHTTLTGDAYWRGRGALLEAIARLDVPVADKRVLEIGTGWHPVLPLLLSLAGAREVVTIDVNPWMTRESLRQSARVALQLSGRLARPIDSHRAALAVRLMEANDPMPLLSDLAIRYRCPYDVTRSDEPDGAFDLMIHSDTLEHVSPEAAVIIAQQSHRLLSPTGWLACRICPGDHFAAADRRITTAHFLRYSDRVWQLMGHGLAYHNRLRASDHVGLLQKAGFSILLAERKIDQRALEELEVTSAVAMRFQGYEATDLATTSVVIIARPTRAFSTLPSSA